MTLLQTDFLPTKGEAFQAVRFMLQDMGLQPGVVNPGDFKVTQHTPNNMTADVAAGSAWVLGQAVTRQGIYHQVNDATVNVGNFSNSDAVNPRVDQVLLVVNDSSAVGGNDNPQFVISQGQPTASATLDNRSGAVVDATLTSTYHNWLRLADVLIPANSTSVVTANIRDRRPWARGAFVNLIGSGATQTSNNGTAQVVGGFAARRIEASGALIRFTVKGRLAISDTTSSAAVSLYLDGAQIPDLGGGGEPPRFFAAPTAGSDYGFTFVQPAQLSQGSHLWDLRFWLRSGSGTVSLYPNYTDVMVEEILRQNADNT